MKTLTLLRHAASLANAGTHWKDGPTTIPLTEEGEDQARAFARNWESRPDLLVVSSYARSIQTAEPLAQKFNLQPVTRNVQEFTYFDFCLTQDEATEMRKVRVAQYWTNLDPLEKAGGSNAESFEDFISRCRSFRHWAETTSFQNCLCVTHGLFMHAFRAIMQEEDQGLTTREFMGQLHKTLPGASYANLQVAEYRFDTGLPHDA
jgi:broad specificity phosphatase PhoE